MDRELKKQNIRLTRIRAMIREIVGNKGVELAVRSSALDSIYSALQVARSELMARSNLIWCSTSNTTAMVKQEVDE